MCCFPGYDKAEVDRLLAEGKLTKESKSVSHSVSSLDRDDEDAATLRQASNHLSFPFKYSDHLQHINFLFCPTKQVG